MQKSRVPLQIKKKPCDTVTGTKDATAQEEHKEEMTTTTRNTQKIREIIIIIIIIIIIKMGREIDCFPQALLSIS
jgi:hypothetical protein